MKIKKIIFLTLSILIIIVAIIILVFVKISNSTSVNNNQSTNIHNSESEEKFSELKSKPSSVATNYNKDNLSINDDYHNRMIKINNNIGLVELMTPPDINFEEFDKFEQVYGSFPQKKFLEKIQDMFNNSDNYQLRKADNQEFFLRATKHKTNKLPKGVVFYGPPGTGKTYLAKCFAKEAQMSFYTITTSDSLEKIEQIFKKARKNSPSIIFCDEAEELMKSRVSTNLETGDAKKTNLFLQELDGVKTDPEYPIYFIAATNYIDRIDSAILSRLEKLYFGYLKEDERLGFLKNSMKKYECDPAAYEYLTQIVEMFNKSLRQPEHFSDLIKNQHYMIDAIGIKESKGKLESANDKLLKYKRFLEFYNQYKQYKDAYNTTDKEKYKTNPNMQQKTVMPEEATFDEDLEMVKTHFYDIQSHRKLDMLIDKAANLASGHGHSRILISDLNEALSEYLGPTIFDQYLKIKNKK
ncbi:AAA+ ATPase [Candidatus Phytoplasma mali]|uniref:AAA+ ATPase n=1 Tax=Phytoplasma mali (strain AT) TaxID=482235 RepID=B3R062_PHYMT|nr:AAA family ATPase [Candidatus Phytoplasma mali]CAP18226.1 AAA+ ATPase [Candidatus Phytoplasma mali]